VQEENDGKRLLAVIVVRDELDVGDLVASVVPDFINFVLRT
jgi:hypothetical protein